MGNGEWVMGNGELGIGQWAMGFFKRGKGERGKGRQCVAYFPPVVAPAVKGTHGKCPMPHAPCPMPHARCPMPHAPFPLFTILSFTSTNAYPATRTVLPMFFFPYRCGMLEGINRITASFKSLTAVRTTHRY